MYQVHITKRDTRTEGTRYAASKALRKPSELESISFGVGNGQVSFLKKMVKTESIKATYASINYVTVHGKN